MAALIADRTEQYVVGSHQGVFARPFRLDDYFLGVSFGIPTASVFMAVASHT